MRFTEQQIAAATRGTPQGHGVGEIGTDSRQDLTGKWFLALVGPRFDGHDHVGKAIEAGAVGVVVERALPAVTSVVVADTTAAYQDLGRAARARLKGPVVGITGSAGKTTTRELVALALAPLGHVHATKANLNNHLGVPMSLMGAPEDSAAAVIEMGTSAPGEIAVLTSIGTPDVRIVLNVGASHLEELGGLEGVAIEKGAMFATASASDVCIANLDDPRVASMPTPGRRVTYGRAPTADIRLMSVAPSALGLLGTFQTPDGPVDVDLPTPAAFIVHNAGAALAAAWSVGIDLHAAARAMTGYRPVGMRLRREDGPGGSAVWNDAYNANPLSMRGAIDTLAGRPGRRTLILGDMLELGGNELALHRQVAEYAAASGVDRVVLIGPRMGIATPSDGIVQCFESVEAAADALRGSFDSRDELLLKASRGARIERILPLLQE